VNAERPLRRFWRGYRRSAGAVLALATFLLILLAAAFAPLISPQNPYDLRQVSLLDSLQPPGSRGFDGLLFALGTDGQGRDILSAILCGLRTSLIVGVLSGSLALLLGVAIGLLAAFRGGFLDALIMRIVDLRLSLPPILIALILLVVLGDGADKIILALVVVQWAFVARTVRGVALVENARDDMDAARGLELSTPRLLFRHLLPNCLPTLIVVATVQVASAMSLEATLSFLGLGLPPTEPSLGLLIANGFRFMMSGNWRVSVFPGLARGEVLGLVGESGSGKSVTGFSILGLVDPPGRVTSGAILFEGRDLRTLPEPELRSLRGRRIAMVFQAPMMTLNPVLRLDTQITDALRAHQRRNARTAWQRARDALGRVGIPAPEERLRAYPHQLSGGDAPARRHRHRAAARACRADRRRADHRARRDDPGPDPRRGTEALPRSRHRARLDHA